MSKTDARHVIRHLMHHCFLHEGSQPDLYQSLIKNLEQVRKHFDLMGIRILMTPESGVATIAPQSERILDQEATLKDLMPLKSVITSQKIPYWDSVLFCCLYFDHMEENLAGLNDEVRWVPEVDLLSKAQTYVPEKLLDNAARIETGLARGLSNLDRLHLIEGRSKEGKRYWRLTPYGMHAFTADEFTRFRELAAAVPDTKEEAGPEDGAELSPVIEGIFEAPQSPLDAAKTVVGGLGTEEDVERGQPGSSFDEFLKEEGVLEEVTARAIERVKKRDQDNDLPSAPDFLN